MWYACTVNEVHGYCCRDVDRCRWGNPCAARQKSVIKKASMFAPALSIKIQDQRQLGITWTHYDRVTIKLSQTGRSLSAWSAGLESSCHQQAELVLLDFETHWWLTQLPTGGMEEPCILYQQDLKLAVTIAATNGEVNPISTEFYGVRPKTSFGLNLVHLTLFDFSSSSGSWSS